MLEIVQGQHFEDKAINVDGKYFFRCTFLRCTILYEGGETNSIQCEYRECGFAFAGPAGRTVGMLLALGWEQPKPEDLMRAINMDGVSGKPN